MGICGKSTQKTGQVSKKKLARTCMAESVAGSWTSLQKETGQPDSVGFRESASFHLGLVVVLVIVAVAVAVLVIVAVAVAVNV